jgi:hypothetical protein
MAWCAGTAAGRHIDPDRRPGTNATEQHRRASEENSQSPRAGQARTSVNRDIADRLWRVTGCHQVHPIATSPAHPTSGLAVRVRPGRRSAREPPSGRSASDQVRTRTRGSRRSRKPRASAGRGLDSPRPARSRRCGHLSQPSKGWRQRRRSRPGAAKPKLRRTLGLILAGGQRKLLDDMLVCRH